MVIFIVELSGMITTTSSQLQNDEELNKEREQFQIQINETLKKAKRADLIPIIAGEPENQLNLGEISLECYVGKNENNEAITLLARNDVQKLFFLDSKRGTALEELFGKVIFRSLITQDVLNSIKYPLYGKRGKGGGMKTALIPAEILPKLCTAITRINREKSSDYKILPDPKLSLLLVKQTEILVESLAEIGIKALIYEVTGYEKRINEWQEVIKKNIADALRPWLKLFPEEFYKQIYRLYSWEWDHYSLEKINHPQCVSWITNDLYKRLPAGSVILEELKDRAIKSKNGGYKHRLHQNLTDYGREQMKYVLGKAELIFEQTADSGGDMNEAMARLNERIPYPNTPQPIPLFD